MRMTISPNEWHGSILIDDPAVLATRNTVIGSFVSRTPVVSRSPSNASRRFFSQLALLRSQHVMRICKQLPLRCKMADVAIFSARRISLPFPSRLHFMSDEFVRNENETKWSPEVFQNSPNNKLNFLVGLVNSIYKLNECRHGAGVTRAKMSHASRVVCHAYAEPTDKLHVMNANQW